MDKEQVWCKNHEEWNKAINILQTTMKQYNGLLYQAKTLKNTYYMKIKTTQKLLYRSKSKALRIETLNIKIYNIF